MKPQDKSTFRAVALCGATALVVLAGCSGGPGQSGPPRVEADVAFPTAFLNLGLRPDDTQALVTITQFDAVSGNFFGFQAAGQGDSAVVTEFEGDTSQPGESFTVDVDEEARADRALIDETEVDFDYNQDETFDFEVNRGEDTLFSGLSVPRPTDAKLKISMVRHQKITANNVADCSRDLIAQTADLVMSDVGGTTTGFVGCLLSEQPELRQITDTICVSETVLLDALVIEEEECSRTNSCLEERIEPAMEAAESYVGVSVMVLEEVISQVRRDAALCPVASDPQTPVADAGPDQATLGTGNLITLNGSNSTDPNGDPMTFSWIQISGTSVDLIGESSATALFNAPSVDDTLVFELTATDDAGNSDTDSVSIQISSTQVPNAFAGLDQQAEAGTLVTLDASASSDPQGDSLTFSWAQLEGLAVMLSAPASATPTFTAPDPGAAGFDILVFEVTVQDSDGNIAKDNINVTVAAQGGG